MDAPDVEIVAENNEDFLIALHMPIWQQLFPIDNATITVQMRRTRDAVLPDMTWSTAKGNVHWDRERAVLTFASTREEIQRRNLLGAYVIQARIEHVGFTFDLFDGTATFKQGIVRP